jgi:hypothetical protein
MASLSAKIEFLYNGDYPGYPCVSINDRWATKAEEAALVSMFGASSLRDLYDKAGAQKINGSYEHMPYEAKLCIVKQNEKD